MSTRLSIGRKSKRSYEGLSLGSCRKKKREAVSQLIQSPSNSTLTSKSSMTRKQQKTTSNVTKVREQKDRFVGSESSESENEDNYYSDSDEDNEDDDKSLAVPASEPENSNVPKSIMTNNDRCRKQMQLIELYGRGSTLIKNENTMRTLTKSLRKVIIPEVKFVQSSKVFGSFEQPDFTEKHCWVNKLFSTIPTLKDATNTLKAEVWMTYKAKLKEQFSLHRSGVTLKIKRKFEQGKSYEN